ncbi:MAG: SUMF1/EgtB/PvdO family nonheme iron enzyme [Cyanobacteria bacterium P01_G01_bin.54]
MTRSSTPDPCIVIVTATKVESNAVIHVFKSITGQGIKPKSREGQVYFELGKVNNKRIVLAQSEMGAIGLGAALQTVGKAIDLFSPEKVIMVGIAFGINEQEQNIGDVLISQQLCSYELQRVSTVAEQQNIILRGAKPHASSRLMRLFKGADLMLEHDLSLAWENPPMRRFGVILTGEKLVDNIDFRDQLLKFEVEAIGGEMEGQGLYAACYNENVDWILVKAICDWADGKKAEDKEVRQQLAAQNAAQFVAYALQFASEEVESQLNLLTPKPDLGRAGQVERIPQQGDSKKNTQHPTRQLFSPKVSRRQLLYAGGAIGAMGGAVAFKGISDWISGIQSTKYDNAFNTEMQEPKIPGEQKFSFETVFLDNAGVGSERITRTAKFFAEDLGDSIALEMVAIPGGTFRMGAPESEVDSHGRERPVRYATVRSFWMGKFVVTQEQWSRVAGFSKIEVDLYSDPAEFKGVDHPVEKVSWHEAIEFCTRLSKQTGKQYRLPSEAEWEYACRAGTTTPFHYGETITTDFANYRGQDWEYKGITYPGYYSKGPRGAFREKTLPVGQFPANDWGLFDMHGNVWEWCADHLHENYEGAPIDGRAWIKEDGNHRMLRGGSWVNGPGDCRSARRFFVTPDSRSNDVGFRVVCNAL